MVNEAQKAIQMAHLAEQKPAVVREANRVIVRLNGSFLERIIINGQWIIIKVTAA
jgi:hypothetical protein